MTTSFMQGCHRCNTGPPLVTRAEAQPLGTEQVVVERVVLCQPCRLKAAKENAAAKLRSTGKDPTK